MDAGLFGPDSVAWRLHADPSMLVGAMRALLVQALEPRAMAGVVQHSDYKADPWGRLNRTIRFVLHTTYGDTRTAEAACAAVRRIHDRVHGVDLVTGRAYSAHDPDLLLWIHAVEVHSAVFAYRSYAGRLADEDADRYVDDAFGAAHRAHASVDAITKYIPRAAAGLLMEQELKYLGHALEAPERPFVAILGGAKVSDKLVLVSHLLGRVDALLIGGGMAFTFLQALGHAVGRSLVEAERVETARAALETAPRRGVRVVLPVDVLAAEGLDSPSGRTVGVREIPADLMGLDIGPRTVEAFAAELRTARTIAWNGPMGVFEKAPFAGGTVAVARAVASAPAFSVIGGGDTIAAVAQAGVTDRIGYISTAGGAFLEYLEGRKLPGVEALAEAA